jgi:hypothetical protein
VRLPALRLHDQRLYEEASEVVEFNPADALTRLMLHIEGVFKKGGAPASPEQTA